MKDLPHHIKKLNRNIIRSARREEREEEEELPEVPTWPETPQSRRKKKKRKMKAQREAHVPMGKTPEERNKEMKKGRVPVFDRMNSNKTKHERPSRKKTPPI